MQVRASGRNQGRIAGYSGTPLPEKLGFKPPMRVVVLGAPPDYARWLGALPAGVTLEAAARKPIRAVHAFVTRRSALAALLARFRRQLEPDGFVWMSWPKKASGVTTDVTEDVIREAALPLGFVDIKVCAVSEVWSGLKLVIRKEERVGTTTRRTDGSARPRIRER